MESEDKTKYRNAGAEKFRDESPDAPDVEAHKFVIEEPSEDEAGKTKTKTKYKTGARGEERDKY